MLDESYRQGSPSMTIPLILIKQRHEVKGDTPVVRQSHPLSGVTYLKPVSGERQPSPNQSLSNAAT